jgi:hypothetical protein
MPPVLNISFPELSGRRVEDMFTGKGRVRKQQGKYILKLVPEPEGAA